MSAEQLELRLAGIERTLADVQQKVNTLAGGPSPASKWWEAVPPASDEVRREWDAMAPYLAYIRQTGESPPKEWKPGDPIPEPDHWE